ncbi:hypothetical protein [uncultured Mucilaginibacter sp.]|uniref:hypothetical protein n=1 Tax=uncultured Mucilaginibacter sp. TaxID=797541 RepID=UPI0026340D1F|nr:hypothetical protein [uncultured Mucilaginibacter sp.]
MKKNQRNQDKPDPSGRFAGPSRTWAAICHFGMPGCYLALLMAVFSNASFTGIN